MKKRLAGIVGALALALTSAASVGCIILFMDEPVAPKSLIN